MITFTVIGQPQGKARARTTIRAGYVHSYTPEKTVLYENLIKMSFLQKYQARPDNCYATKASIISYYRIPTSWSKKKREQARNLEIVPLVKPDVDNISKCILDALNGLAYKDDSQVVSLTTEKYYSDNPRVEVIIKDFRRDKNNENQQKNIQSNNIQNI